VPWKALPAIRPSIATEPYGHTPADGPFGSRIPVCGNLGDQQAALAGQGCFAAGEAKNTYGTGSFLLEHVGGNPVGSSFGLLSTAACAGPGERAYALEGSVAVSGAAVQWLRDNLGLIGSAAETEAIAASVSDSGGLLGAGVLRALRAARDMRARGAIVGLTRLQTAPTWCATHPRRSASRAGRLPMPWLRTAESRSRF
jgi:glycerol kinase